MTPSQIERGLKKVGSITAAMRAAAAASDRLAGRRAELIQELLDAGVSVSAIARAADVTRRAVRSAVAKERTA